jgi:hypothetical protein
MLQAIVVAGKREGLLMMDSREWHPGGGDAHQFDVIIIFDNNIILYGKQIRPL